MGIEERVGSWCCSNTTTLVSTGKSNAETIVAALNAVLSLFDVVQSAGLADDLAWYYKVYRSRPFKKLAVLVVVHRRISRICTYTLLQSSTPILQSLLSPIGHVHCLPHWEVLMTTNYLKEY